METSVKKVCVLLPVYGKAPYIEETLDSLTEQDNSLFELLLVKDRCISPVEELLSKHKYDFKWSIITSQKPGIVQALNLGLKSTKCELVARIDSDDVMEPGRIETQVREFERKPDIILVGSSITLINENSKVIGIDLYPVLHKEILQEFLTRNPFAHPSVMYRREIISDLGGYREFFQGAEDYDLWLRLSQIGTLKNIETPLTRYRIHKNQVTRREKTTTDFATRAALTSYRLKKAGKPEIPEQFSNLNSWVNYLKQNGQLIEEEKKNKFENRRSEFMVELGLKRGDSNLRYFIFVLAYASLHPWRSIQKLIRKLRGKAHFILLKIKQRYQFKANGVTGKINLVYAKAIGPIDKWRESNLTKVKSKHSARFLLLIFLYLITHPKLSSLKAISRVGAQRKKRNNVL